MPFKLLTPDTWRDYALLDTGGREKLEKFGRYVLRRPEPQAVWEKTLPETEWERLADASFRREKSSEDKGEWISKPHMPGQWWIEYPLQDHALRFRLGLTAFKHVGIFPEQAANWAYIYRQVRRMSERQPRVLNLFAYTGGASLAAKAAGADVIHVDAVRQVVNWSRENMEASRLDGIRWVVEDAMKFVRREVRRGNRYAGILLDPPAYGRGPEGEKWVLEEGISELFACCNELLAPDDSFFIANLYSMGFSSLILESLCHQHFPGQKDLETGELYQQDHAGHKLPLGTFLRFATF